PSTALEPSSATSPTRATTLEVPISRPTIRFRSERLSIAATVVGCTVSRVAAPADGKSVCVTHVHVCNVLAALRHQLERRRDEFLETLVHLPPAEPHGDAVREVELPGAARIETQRRQTQARLLQPALRREIALRHGRLLAFGPRQLRQLRRYVPLVGRKQLAASVEQAVLAPARGGNLLDDEHIQAARPGSLHTHGVDPGQR